MRGWANYFRVAVSSETFKALDHWMFLRERQKHKCPICGESLYNGEELHKHHIVPKSQGGKDTYDNLRWVHYICHQQIHGNNSLGNGLSRVK
ncbi:HNH endonuclease [Coleofasciculus sp. G2-EDA-02]|uniref:HNH endonuclease n=1 Tax=Coleofasciculus sp. G2-EDA-02 TaxID=3069529 RepID=UPI0032F9938E